MHLGILARVSTEEQRKGQTIQAQISELENYAKQNNLTIVDRFLDEGWSGTLEHRPALDRMNESIMSGAIDTVLMYHPDRLSRDSVQQLLLQREYEKQHITLIFTSQPNLHDQSPEVRLIQKTIIAMTSELDKMRITDRFRIGKLRKVRSGHVLTSKAPYGLTYVRGNREENKSGYFTHNSQELPTLKLILEWAKEGKSQRWIVKELANRHIPTREGNESWAKSTISKIISINLSVYAGEWYFQKYASIEPKKRTNTDKYIKRPLSSRILRNKSDWLKVSLDPSLTILTQEEVDQIRSRQSDNKEKTAGHTKYEYLLQHKAHCSKCSGLMYSDSFHHVGYYRCADRRRRFPNPPQCDGGSVKVESLDQSVWGKLQELISDPSIIHDQAKRFFSDKPKNNTTDWTGKLKALDIEQERLLTAYREGVATLDELKSQREAIEVKRTDILQQKRTSETEQASTSFVTFDSFMSDSKSLFEDLQTVLASLTFEERKTILEWLHIKVNYADKQYVITGSLPIAQSCPQSVYVMPKLVQLKNRAIQPSKYSIPFKLQGSIPQSIHRHI